MAKHKCQCARCWPMSFEDPTSVRMILCEHCGNKRCPHAEDHDLLCMGSNVPDQPKVLRHPRAPITLSQSEPAD